MLSPAFVGRLRRAGVWTLGRKLHSVLSPPVCAAIHLAVQRLHRALPADLVLKHIYDYRLVYIHPALVESMLHTGSWRLRAERGPSTRWVRARSWYELGGGWKTARRHVTRNLHGLFVAPGEWDTLTRPLRHRLVVKQLFVEGRSPQETDDYRAMHKRIEAGEFGFTHGCVSLRDLDDYFADLIRAFESIRADGYKPQEELGNDGSDEIRVCIDRYGALSIFSGGTHRLAMARLLGLDRVPVLVQRVHADWVAACMARYETTDPARAISLGISELEARSPSRSRGD